MSNLSDIINEEALRDTNLHINLTGTPSSLSKAVSSNVSSSISTQHNFTPFTCKCHESLNSSDYLRQNVMMPLSWAIGRALKYVPSDPIHYIAHQLLRWKYGNVSQDEMDNARQFITSATMTLDQRFMEKRKREEDAKRLNEIVVKNINCEVLNQQQSCCIVKNDAGNV